LRALGERRAELTTLQYNVEFLILLSQNERKIHLALGRGVELSEQEKQPPNQKEPENDASQDRSITETCPKQRIQAQNGSSNAEIMTYPRRRGHTSRSP